MSCPNSQNVNDECCSRPRSSCVIIIVLYILLAIILGSALTW